MHKIIIILSIVFFLVCGCGQKAGDMKGGEKETVTPKVSPMATFMGEKWGVNVNDFLKSFKYKDDLKIFDDGAGNQAYSLENFKLTQSISIKKILFYFLVKDGKTELPMVKENYDKLFLSVVMMLIEPSQYDELMLVLIEKYGKPVKSKETVATWENIDLKRTIILNKYMTKDSSLVVFGPLDTDDDKKKRAQEAADKL